MSAHIVVALGAQYFAVQRRCLALVGFDMNSTALPLKHPLWTFFLVFCILSHNVPMVIYGLQNTADLLLLTDNLGNVWQGSLSSFKMLVLIFKRHSIAALLLKLHAFNEHACRIRAQQQLIAQENALDLRISSLFHRAVYMPIVGSAIAPIAIGFKDFMESGNFRLRTPLNFNFWLDDTRPIYYWSIYVWGVLGIAAVSWLAAAADTLYCWLLHNIVAQFHVLEYRLDLATQQCSKHDTIKMLSECVQLHVQAIELARDFSGIFAEIVFVKYTFSYLQLCSLAYRFSRGSWNAQVPFRTGFLLAVLVQLGIYSYGGEYLKQQSSRVANSLYASFDWSHVSLKTSKMLRLIMMRSQRASLVTGYMYTVDLSLLLWASKTAGSFLTMLKTFER